MPKVLEFKAPVRREPPQPERHHVLLTTYVLQAAFIHSRAGRQEEALTLARQAVEATDEKGICVLSVKHKELIDNAFHNNP